jgi:hypothetical protein
MICVVYPIAIHFSFVIFIQLGAKVEEATSKNDAFQILRPLDFRFKLVLGKNYLALTWWLLRNTYENSGSHQALVNSGSQQLWQLQPLAE